MHLFKSIWSHSLYSTYFWNGLRSHYSSESTWSYCQKRTQVSPTLLIRAPSWQWADVSLNSFQEDWERKEQKREFPLPWCVLEGEAKTKIAAAEVGFWEKTDLHLAFEVQMVTLWSPENYSGMWILHVQKQISIAPEESLNSLESGKIYNTWKS